MPKKPVITCPKCKQGVLNVRIKRNFFVKVLLFWLPLKRYRCNVCDRKTYVRPVARPFEPKLQVVG